MEVVSLSPLRVGSIVWQPRAGAFRLTVVAKATFLLVPGEARLAEEQEDLCEEDNHWNDDAARSVFAPNDFAPFKMRADVLVVGHAFAPRAEPVRSLVARVVVAEIDKALEITGSRRPGDDEPAPFTRMPLRYERAAGGQGTANPVGVGPDAGVDAAGYVAAPNIAIAGKAPALVEPAGFGPISPAWPSRRDQLGRHAATWSRAGWSRAPLPEDIELGYFNAGPRDQQIEVIRENERIALENLHPEIAHLVTRLPGLHPRAFVERSRGPDELALRADTLWIDTDRARCTVAWRGQVQLESPNDAGRVLVALEDGRQRLTWADVERLAATRGQPAKPNDRRAPDARPPAGSTSPQPRPEGKQVPQVVPNVRVPPQPSHVIAAAGVQVEGDRTASSTKMGLGPASRFMVSPPPPLAPGGGALTGKRQSAHPPPLPPGDAPADGAPVKRPLRDLAPPLPSLVDEPSLPTMDLTASHVLGAMAAALPFRAPPPGTPIAHSMATPSVRHAPAPPGSRPMIDDMTATEEPVDLSSVMPAWLAPAPASSPQPEVVGPAPPGLVARAKDAKTRLEAGKGSAARGSQPPDDGLDETRRRERTPEIEAALRGLPPVKTELPPKRSTREPESAPPRVRSTVAERPAVHARSSEPPPPADARPREARPEASARRAPANEAAEVPMTSRRSGAEMIELVHVDEAAIDRLRGPQGFAALLELSGPPAHDDAPTADVTSDVRRHAYAALARGAALDVGDVANAIAASVGADGTFTPPLLLVAAELEIGFSEVELLRATLLALEPLLPRAMPPGSAEHALGEAVEQASAWLAKLGEGGASSVAEALTQRIRDAVARASSFVTPGYLEAHAERTVLERRAYQTRAVLGHAWLRADLVSPRTHAAVPAYLPLAAAAHLPLFTRFAATALVEAHPRQDQFEGHPACVRVLAIGRRLGAQGATQRT